MTLAESKGVSDLTVVESDRGWRAVYTTMVDGELRYWNLESHGEAVTQEVGGDPLGAAGVSSGGGRYLVYWLEGCPAVRMFYADGSEVDLPSNLAELGCNGVS
ncbi:MAG: hypothetical protein GEU79_04890, partial [Acidimicrobiia bacterium]|nr:hypothetical protein [Acidimicrobiia bacterium]